LKLNEGRQEKAIQDVARQNCSGKGGKSAKGKSDHKAKR
jgi:hypothetical protein